MNIALLNLEKRIEQVDSSSDCKNRERIITVFVCIFYLLKWTHLFLKLKINVKINGSGSSLANNWLLPSPFEEHAEEVL